MVHRHRQKPIGLRDTAGAAVVAARDRCPVTEPSWLAEWNTLWLDALPRSDSFGRFVRAGLAGDERGGDPPDALRVNWFHGLGEEEVM
jgi:hypothetical protein